MTVTPCLYRAFGYSDTNTNMHEMLSVAQCQSFYVSKENRRHRSLMI